MTKKNQKRIRLENLVDQIKKAHSAQEKFTTIFNFLEKKESKNLIADSDSLSHKIVKASLLAIEERDLLTSTQNEKLLQEKLLSSLALVDHFYEELGGIVGYHVKMLSLIDEKNSPAKQKTAISSILPAVGMDITKETGEVKKSILAGLRSLPLVGELIPLGGAADRLKLRCEKSGQPLPAAFLPFLGKTLLELLIRDLEGVEFLYRKLFHKRVVIPIAMMTSADKENHQQIGDFCEKNSWFGRGRDRFFLFCQPSVPTVTLDGQWCKTNKFEPLMKPGGHGVIWRLARDAGVFNWLFSLGCLKGVVRQINNPLAGVDYGILAFLGYGVQKEKAFGFASCPRQVNAAEGINVLIETKEADGYSYTLTNIEYCDFKKFGILDEPVDEGSPYSKFPSNTNLLFFDLHQVLNLVNHSPIPGVLVNVKKIAHDLNGKMMEQEIVRLESTMQNIADFFIKTSKTKLHSIEELPVFLTHNQRSKTISTTKREFSFGSSLLETPEGAFLDLMKNGRDLLRRCRFQLPVEQDPSLFFSQGPSLIFLYHPALGPLYSIIEQKLTGGVISHGSELQLEIAEIELSQLNLSGSLLITATDPLGLNNSSDPFSWGGRCILKKVRVINQGIDTQWPNVYWKNEISRKGVCQIILHGCSEFFAEDVVFEGSHFIEVEDGYSLKAYMEHGKLLFTKTRIKNRSWYWDYQEKEDNIILSQKTRKQR